MANSNNEVKYDAVEIAGRSIAYSYCHARRRTLGITIRPDNTVSVRVPLRTSVNAIRAFVTSRAEWIAKIWSKQESRPAQQKQDYSPGSVFMYCGDAYTLEFAKGPQHSLQLHAGLMILTAPEVPSEETARGIIDKWYRKQATWIVKERSLECHRMVQGEILSMPPIIIRSMKSRWGSYSYKTGRIALALNLIKMPPACLDYVIIHELCHIKVRHHGPGFWQMVSRYCPDYLAVRKMLRNSP